MVSIPRQSSLSGRAAVGCFAAAFLCSVLVAVSGAAARDVLHIRHFTAPQYTRVVLDMSGPGSFEVRRVHNPDRLAINIMGAGVTVVAPVEVGDGLVRQIRTNTGSGRAQIVVDLGYNVEFRSFSLPAIDGRFDRIVVDVLRPDQSGLGPTPAEKPSAPGPAPFRVIIDPGHGGLDPGAVRDGVSEKTVVLEIAREITRLLNALPGYEAVMTRRGDYGLELWERVEFARKQRGDLFLSIHCNTHPRADVAGMEVYFLSLQGASDRESAARADRENAAQLVGLDPKADNDDLVVNILMDLRTNQVLRESSRLSWQLLDAADASGLVQARKVKQATFRVLKNLAMPSALVELAYLSNADDMRVLRDRHGRGELAVAMVRGIVAWRGDGAAVAQLAGSGGGWTSRYRVRRGDSLWELAHVHGTTVREISQHNNLHSGAISVGQELRLPAAGYTP